MKWEDLLADGALDSLGLASIRAQRARSLGLFGLGLCAGAALALLLAPRSGAELRRELRRRLGLTEASRGNGQEREETL